MQNKDSMEYHEFANSSNGNAVNYADKSVVRTRQKLFDSFWSWISGGHRGWFDLRQSWDLM